MIEDLRKQLKIEEFDYQLLLSFLNEYKKPRNKITQLIRSNAIIRVKKGLYVFGEKYRRSPICTEALANVIYGPSYISLEYALQHYNLIPERIDLVTNVTTKLSKSFSTPIGNFSYQHLNLKRYQVGMTSLAIDQYHEVLIATPEKALADLVATRKDLADTKIMRKHLLESLRIEENDLKQFRLELLYEIAEVYGTPASRSLVKVVKECQ